MKPHIILGPPGTGKTTRLLNLLDEQLQAGVLPQDICFLTFTKKAAQEARDRAMHKFGFSKDDLPYFRTIHSLGFKVLGLSVTQMMRRKDYQMLGELVGMQLDEISPNHEDEITTYESASLRQGHRLMFIENLSRLRGESLYEAWEKEDLQDMDFNDLKLVHDMLLKYKETRQLNDFTDLLTKLLESGKLPTFSAVFVDEAQDLSKLQWRVAKGLMEKSSHAFVAGDDDQAIFRWAGADVDELIEMEGTVEVLSKSYRVPKIPYQVAQDIVKQIKIRRPKAWDSKDEEGKLNWYSQPEDVDISQGTWFLLARNNRFLKRLNEMCISLGVPFDSPIESPMRSGVDIAIEGWKKLKMGQSVPVHVISTIYGMIYTGSRVARGSKDRLNSLPPDRMLDMHDLWREYGLKTEEDWTAAFDKLTSEEITYYNTALSRGEKFSGVPRIRIDTIHGVKGGEADHVLLMSDMAIRSHESMLDNPDDEHRVWYVAVTRCRKSLHIILPQTKFYYERFHI